MLFHWVARSRSSRDMMQHMIKLHPPAVKKVNCVNRLPLHYASYWNRRVAAESLAAAFPAALSMKDMDNKTPFQVIGKNIDETMTDDEKLLFKQTMLRAIMEAYYSSNEAVLVTVKRRR